MHPIASYETIGQHEKHPHGNILHMVTLTVMKFIKTHENGIPYMARQEFHNSRQRLYHVQVTQRISWGIKSTNTTFYQRQSKYETITSAITPRQFSPYIQSLWSIGLKNLKMNENDYSFLTVLVFGLRDKLFNWNFGDIWTNSDIRKQSANTICATTNSDHAW